jgi:hypothetical protein
LEKIDYLVITIVLMENVKTISSQPNTESNQSIVMQLFEEAGIVDEYRGYDNPNAVIVDGPDTSD